MTIEGWIDFAKGPLFALTFLIMILGLLRHFIIQVYQLLTGKGRRLRRAPWKTIVLDALSWVFPIKHLIKGTIFFSAVSFLFHIGVIIVPLFLADHIVLWNSFFGVNLPAIGQNLADYLTLFTIACLLVLLIFRVFSARHRAMSCKTDYVLLFVILITFTAGYLASHPNVNFMSWEGAMLIHLLSAELLFVLIPFTKLAHIVLFVFDRISAVHWQLRPGSGDKVAKAIYGEEVHI